MSQSRKAWWNGLSNITPKSFPPGIGSSSFPSNEIWSRQAPLSTAAYRRYAHLIPASLHYKLNSCFSAPNK